MPRPRPWIAKGASASAFERWASENMEDARGHADSVIASVRKYCGPDAE